MQVSAILVAFVGGLAILVFGMQQLTDSLQRIAGERVRSAVA